MYETKQRHIQGCHSHRSYALALPVTVPCLVLELLASRQNMLSVQTCKWYYYIVSLAHFLIYFVNVYILFLGDSFISTRGLRTKLRGLSPRANYILTESGLRLSAKLVPTFADRGCRVVSATDPHSRVLGFLDRRRYYFFQVAPQL
jgi:hypothetical protein